jgi:hypothetical protein
LIQRSDDNKKIFAYLLLTCKNVSLYPEGHSISTNSIKQFHEMLVAHIRQHGDLKIEIEKDHVICQGTEVQKGPAEEGTLPFTLFRDGIRWLEFTEGITLEEIRDALSIIHKYSVLTTEPEGDIVTAFWESLFDHVLYKADDFVADQTAEQIDSLAKWDAMHNTEETESGAEDKPATDDVNAASVEVIESFTIDPGNFLLTPEEKIELQAMIDREERASASEHLKMLLDILIQIQEEKDYTIILGVLSEEFDAFYHRRDFESALMILDGLRKVLTSGKVNTPQIVALIASHYQDMASDARCLKPLEEIWSTLNAKQIETMKGIFQHLIPKAVPTLMRLLLLGQPSRLEEATQDSIIALLNQDAGCLERLSNDPDERLIEKLISLLPRLKQEISLKYLLKLARHPAASIRRTVIKALGQLPGNQTSAIFEFMDDPDPSVRQAILTHLGQSRSEIAEDLLMKYLQNPKLSAAKDEHIIECFRTLGKCGSARSISFLRSTFLHRKWLAAFQKSPFREGAALALVELKIPEAKETIETAGRSFYPGLRRIARKAGKKFF